MTQRYSKSLNRSRTTMLPPPKLLTVDGWVSCRCWLSIRILTTVSVSTDCLWPTLKRRGRCLQCAVMLSRHGASPTLRSMLSMFARLLSVSQKTITQTFICLFSSVTQHLGAINSSRTYSQERTDTVISRTIRNT